MSSQKAYKEYFRRKRQMKNLEPEEEVFTIGEGGDKSRGEGVTSNVKT